MKLAIFFVRKALRRKPAYPSHMELVSNWTTRDWADLPTHHPRRLD